MAASSPDVRTTFDRLQLQPTSGTRTARRCGRSPVSLAQQVLSIGLICFGTIGGAQAADLAGGGAPSPGAQLDGAPVAPFDPSRPVIVEGDILVAPGGLRGVGAYSEYRRWSNGEVPYLIDAMLPGATVLAIDAAVAQWNAASGITLTAVADDAEVPYDHLLFTPGTGCASWVGRQGGEQEVWIGPSCTDGSVMHEIGHALGLEHEHTRADRDQFIEILWDNIVPEKQHNFTLAPVGTRSLGPYDIGSIMHYGTSNFSIDGSPTLLPRDAATDVNIGQRNAPSAGDLASIARLYASDLALSVSVDDERDASEVTLIVTNQHQQGAHDLELSVADDDAQPVSLDAGWTCEPQDGYTRCRLPRLVGNATSKVVLALGGPRTMASLKASLASKTPDLDASNNGGIFSDGQPPALAGALSRGPDEIPDDSAQQTGEAASLGHFSAQTLLMLCSVLAIRRFRAIRRPV